MIDSPLKNPSEFTVVMGSAKIAAKKERSIDMQVRKVIMLYPHEEYTQAIALNDIGLVKVKYFSFMFLFFVCYKVLIIEV